MPSPPLPSAAERASVKFDFDTSGDTSTACESLDDTSLNSTGSSYISSSPEKEQNGRFEEGGSDGGSPSSRQSRGSDAAPTIAICGIESGAIDQAQIEEGAELIGGLFSSRKPKDTVAGMSSGLKSVLKGTVFGAASLVSLPIIGAQEEGAVGFAKGLGTGLFTAVALPVTGFCVGVSQIARGIGNEAESIKSQREGKIWDEESRQWKQFSLSKEIGVLEDEQKRLAELYGSNAASMGAVTGNRKVADTAYYDLIEVGAGATQADIRKAYRKKAMALHPDKNPGDKEAEKKFQELSNAYQVLGDEKKRANYDKFGLPSDESGQSEKDAMSSIDPVIFFEVMFGISGIEGYTGELYIASMVGFAFNDMVGNMTADGLPDHEAIREQVSNTDKERDEMQLKQKFRVNSIANFLLCKITPLVEGEINARTFRDQCREEAKSIDKGSEDFGHQFLAFVGSALKLEAEEYVGFEKTIFGLDGHAARAKKRVNSIKDNASIIYTGSKLLSKGAKDYGELKKEQDAYLKEEGLINSESAEVEVTHDGGILEEDDENKNKEAKQFEAQQKMMGKVKEKVEDSMPLWIEAAMIFNKSDITKTLKRVCKHLFNDCDVEKEDRIQRAKAILILGEEFDERGRATIKDIGSTSRERRKDGKGMMTRANVALQSTMAKSQGQEVDLDQMEELIQETKKMPPNGELGAGEEGESGSAYVAEEAS